MAKQEKNVNAFQQLKLMLKEKRTDRLYFFHGEETFLLNYYLQQIKKLLIDPLTEAFNFHKLTNETFSVTEFANCVENLPMMAENTLVLVDEVDVFKLSEVDREKIIGIFSDIPDYCTVVFTCITTPWKPDKRMKKLWDAVEQSGNIVEFAKQEQRDLIPWITRHFAANKKRITPDLCSYLIEITGGTMTALAGEISKISAYSGADEIRKSDIDAVTEPVLDAVVFQMTEFIGRGEYGVALQKLRQLRKMQQEPLQILGAIGAHFRQLSTARILSDSGKNANDLVRDYGFKDFAARKAMGAAKQFPARFYRKAAELIVETDRGMKTSLDDPDRLLEMLLMSLAQEARNG